MSNQWEKVAENLVRYVPSGVLYLRAKVGGKFIRRSLDLTSVRAAKLKRDKMLAELRAMAGKFPECAVTKDEALAYTRAWYESRSLDEQKESTLIYNRQILTVLGNLLPRTSPKVWTAKNMEDWWAGSEITRYSPTRRNGTLDVLRKMFDLLIERGVRGDDPTARLKRASVRVKVVKVPSAEDFDRVLQDIESQPSDFAFESAHFVSFLAYSGCRIGEARCITWADIGEKTIAVTGGDAGTKNREVRHVPIIRPMRDLLETMQYEGAAGLLFSIKSPRFAITNACRRCNVEPFTPHTLRHMFATVCIESGVDIPTVSRWLGHKDGGALAMRVYGHLRDDHSIRQAERVRF